MAVFMIGYDLHEGEDYEDLINAIKKISGGNWWHCLDSTWFIAHSGNAETIRNSLTPHIKNPNNHNGDKLLVLKINTPANWACTSSLGDNCIQLLRDNIAK